MAGFQVKVPGKTLEEQIDWMRDQADYRRKQANEIRRSIPSYVEEQSRMELADQAAMYEEEAADWDGLVMDASRQALDGLDGDEIYSGRGPVDVHLDRAQMTQGFADRLRRDARYYGSREYARRIGSGVMADIRRDEALREAASWQRETDRSMEEALQIEARIAAGTY